MRRLGRFSGALLGGALLAGCDAPTDALRRYLDDPAARREALEQSLWFRDNDYARLRLARFAVKTAPGWDGLPLWLPEAAPVRIGPVTQPCPLPLPDPLPAGGAALREALVRIGEAAFFDYPVQLVGGFDRVAADPAQAAAYGLWRSRAPTDAPDAAPRQGGLLRVELPGGTALSLSCATCHASGAPVQPGRPNQALDLGALAQDQGAPGAPWGPGRVDVTPDGVDNPAAIPDLRLVALQRYLHHDATLRNDDPDRAPVALAVRIETLIVTALGQGGRPPPAVALGLALYLRGLPLSPPAPPSSSAAAAAARGQALFAGRCAGCHAAPDGAGEPVPLEIIGTDAALGRSRERGTGAYRAPTLRAVADRGALLHDGAVPDVAALLDPARLDPGYRGGLRGAGAVPGHTYGLELSAADRGDLLTYVRGL